MVRGKSYERTNMFPHVSGCYCFLYTNPALKKPNHTIEQSLCATTILKYPCILLPDNMTELPYDYKNPGTLQVLGDAFVSSEVTEKWIQCSKSAISCCSNMDENVVDPGDGYCSANWDGWSCWDKSPVGTTQHQVCPDYIYSAEKPSCQQYSDKKCFETGYWNETTDYGPCSRRPMLMLENRTSYHVTMLYVSIATTFPALIIFFSYRKLRITRVTLHRNLILFIAIRNAFSIAVKTAIILDAINDVQEGVMVKNSAWCRALSFMDKLSGSAVYSCMLLEGIFLHRLIAAAFKGEPKMLYYYLLAIGVAILPVGIWVAITAAYNDVNCWAVDSTNYGYIVDGPRILTLVVNTLLMLDIVRVLCTKLRSINTAKSSQVRRMTRATILLMPLFGVQFLLTVGRPNTEDCDLEQAYYYIFYTMDGLQGILVALLYCYLNKEVHVQVLRSYNVLMVRLYRLFGKEYVPKRRTTWAYSERRQTATSMVMPDDVKQSSVSFPSNASTPTESSQRSGVPYGRSSSIVVGSVSDILSQKDGPHSPGTRFPRSSMSFPRNSLKSDGSPLGHFAPNRIQSARLRKVSAVSEEDGEAQVSQRKARDSDEEVLETNADPCRGQMDSTDESLFEDTGVEVLSMPTGLNLGFSMTSQHTADTLKRDRVKSHTNNATSLGDETKA